MEYFGLLFELVFLSMGIYLYMFSSGRLKSNNILVSEKSEEFRKENAGWLRIASLALMAIMLINIITHIKQLWDI